MINLQAAFSKLERQIRDEINSENKNILLKIEEELQRDIWNGFTEDKKGKHKPRYGRMSDGNRNTRRSGIGETPALDKGTLRRGTKYKIVPSANKVQLNVTNDVPYVIHFNHKNSHQVTFKARSRHFFDPAKSFKYDFLPRPFIIPNIEKAKEKLDKIITSEIYMKILQKAINNAVKK